MAAVERHVSTQIPALLVRPRAELARRPVVRPGPPPPSKRPEPSESELDEHEPKSGTFLVVRDEK